MTKEEYWKCFLAALRMDRTLAEELTRITMTDVETEPEDWTTYFEVATVAERMNIEVDDVYDLIDDGDLAVKDFGDDIFMIPLISVKECMLYDRKRLLEVPWDEVVGVRPKFMERLFEEESVNCCALQSEALYLRGEVDDSKRQGNQRENVETNKRQDLN